MAKYKNRIHEFHIWKDEPRQAVADTLQGIFSDCIKLGTKLGMNQTQLEHMFKLRDRVPKLYSLERWTSVCFSIALERNGSSWGDLDVKLKMEIDQNYSTGEITANVDVRWDGSSKDPSMAARMGNMLSEVAALAHEVQRELNAMIDAIPDEAICPAKELADSQMFDRRRFLDQNIDDYNVRVFVTETLLPMLKGADTIVHRFEGKERKLLNKVPEEVAFVEHKRGGPSTITLTKGTLEHLAQLADDKAKKEAAA